MKYSFLLGVLLLWGAGTYGQASKATLNGMLVMATGEEFPYKIELTDSNGLVNGIAYTYSEPEQTRVFIKGKIDKQQRKLSFKETEIIESHSVQTKAFMCLVHAALEYRQGMLTGPAASMESDNTACTPGTITFKNTEEINTLFSSNDKYDMVINMGGRKEVRKPKAEEPVPVADEALPTDKVTAGVEKSYNWMTDSMTIDLWDGGNYDGDMVTLTYDGKTILNRFVINKTRQRLKVAVTPNKMHTLAIIAENEGSDPPNTASLLLVDGEKPYSVIAYNKKGMQSLINIKRIQ